MGGWDGWASVLLHDSQLPPLLPFTSSTARNSQIFAVCSIATSGARRNTCVPAVETAMHGSQRVQPLPAVLTATHDLQRFRPLYLRFYNRYRVSAASAKNITHTITTSASVLLKFSTPWWSCFARTMEAQSKKRKMMSSALGLKGVAFSAVKAIVGVMRSMSGSSVPCSALQSRRLKDDVLRKAIADNCEKVQMQTIGGGRSVWVTFVRPDKWLQTLARISSSFAAFMHSIMVRTGGALRLVVYHDEVTPGNVIRPDNRRKSTLMYHSYLDFEKHRLKDEKLWFPAAVVRHGTIENMVGGVSAMTRRYMCVLKPLLQEPSTVALECLPGCAVPLRLEPTAFIFDERALKETVDSKGSSGNKPCSKCINVVSKRLHAEGCDDFFVTLDESDASKFCPMTDAHVHETLQHLAESKPVLPNAQFEDLETRMGFNFNPEGLLLDADLRKWVKPSQFWYDSAHCLYSKGAVSWEIASFLESCNGHFHGSVRQLQEYVCDERWRAPSFCKFTASERKCMVSNALLQQESYKGSIQQTMSVLPLVVGFALEVVLPTGMCANEVKSLLKLFRVCRLIYKIGHDKHSYDSLPPEVTKAHSQYLDAFSAAYGIERVKPKHHFVYHVHPFINTTVLERKHRCWKSGVLPHIKRLETLEESSLARLLLIGMSDMSAFNAGNRLTGLCQAASPVMCQLLQVDAAQLSTQIAYDGAIVGVDDVILFPTMDKACVVLACLEMAEGGVTTFWALVNFLALATCLRSAVVAFRSCSFRVMCVCVCDGWLLRKLLADLRPSRLHAWTMSDHDGPWTLPTEPEPFWCQCLRLWKLGFPSRCMFMPWTSLHVRTPCASSCTHIYECMA